MMRALPICALLASPALAQDGPDWVNRFMQDVQMCWNVSQADEPWPAVTVRFAMNPDATPVADSFELVEATEATDLATQAAFESMRRAVIRCAQDGYDLPQEDFALWDDIEITFDPRPVVLAQSASSIPDAQWHDDLRSQIMQCYDVGETREGGTNVVIDVSFELDTQARPVANSFGLGLHGSPYPDIQNAAYVAARQAVLDCGAEGYDVPLDLFSQWQSVRMSFFYPVPLNDLRPQPRPSP